MSSTDVVLFGHWICPFSVRVEFALAQKAIAYSLVDVPPRAVRPKGFVVPEEFIAHSPKLEVPMVRVGETYLADSIPILQWLEELFPSHSLSPTADAQHALMMERVDWLDKYVYRPMIGVYYGTDSVKIAEASAAFANALETVDSWLLTSPWLAGDQPTLAEAIMAGLYTRWSGLQRLGMTAVLPQSVETHWEHMHSLAGWQVVAWSDEQTDEFVGRFLKYREIQNS
jgi:glutathione S-transferase